MKEHLYSSQKIMIGVICCAVICIYSPDIFAFADPIVRKAHDAQRNLVKIGKVITALSFVVSIIMFVMGRPQWKWVGCIVMGGTLLTSVDPIIAWISY